MGNITVYFISQELKIVCFSLFLHEAAALQITHSHTHTHAHTHTQVKNKNRKALIKTVSFSGTFVLIVMNVARPF